MPSPESTMQNMSDISLECSQRLTELLEFTCAKEFEEEMIVAREIFMLLTGKVNDEDLGYEQRMQMFQEFFLFEHRLSDPHAGLTLYELFLERQHSIQNAEWSAAGLLRYEAFRSAYRSLFIVEKSTDHEVYVRDLIGKRTVGVYPLCSFSLGGLPSSQVFEGRLLHYRGRHFFTGAFIFHVPGVTDLIERTVKMFLMRASEAKLESPGFEYSGQWKAQLASRLKLLRGLQSQREEPMPGVRKRAVDHLRLTKNISEVFKMVSAPETVTSFGSQDENSCFVAEVPLVQRASLLNALAQCEVRALRYRHIEPLKVYTKALALDSDGFWIPRPVKPEDFEAQAVHGASEST